ncbi:hypothetical protein BCD67_23680 [Oscillatoriales cyanobacterium USR001]|nr:hypothetical protein BCD67_23680 [Oscillatoriales cyanobacterium USR001]
MSDWLKLFPIYLLVPTILLVIVPAFLAALQRISLYGEIVGKAKEVRLLLKDNNAGSKPRIVEDLEQRFKAASEYLETVNSGALVDGIYSQQRFIFWGFSFGYDRIDYFCRILPNLLLSFGLLGTFLGITLNLSSLSETVIQLQGNQDINQDLVFAELQKPLQGMGIAFITSLIAVFFSALLTVVNLVWNTGLAKSQLISYLEDYLDNIYQPTLQGKSRLDKVVKNMADSFDNFLTRFGQTVREGVESALQDKIQEIFEANLKAANLAQQVYGGLAEASGTISRGANDFQESAGKFIEVSKAFEKNEFPQKLSLATINLANIQNNFAKSASSLADSVQSLGTTLSQLQNFSAELVNMTAEIHRLNQIAFQAVELQQANQLSLAENNAAESNRNSQQSQLLAENINSYVHHLGEIKSELAELVETLRDNLESPVVDKHISDIQRFPL